MLGDDARLAAEVAEEFRTELWDMTMVFGLPPKLAHSLTLAWTGQQFEARSAHPGIQEYEYGDGKRPPKAPIRKSMNRLRPRLDAALQSRIEAGIDELVLSGVEF